MLMSDFADPKQAGAKPVPPTASPAVRRDMTGRLAPDAKTGETDPAPVLSGAPVIESGTGVTSTAKIDPKAGIVRDPWWRWNPYRRSQAAVSDDEAIRRDAYAQGRRDEQRRRSPIAAFLIILVAIFGLTVLVLAAFNGSFAAGGAVIDQELPRLPGQAARVVDNVRAVSQTSARPATPVQTPAP